MTASTIGRAALALAGAGALATFGGGLAHADEVPGSDSSTETGADGSAGTEQGAGGSDGSATEESGSEDAGESASGSVPVFLLQDAPALPAPEGLLTPVDLTAPVFGLLDGLS